MMQTEISKKMPILSDRVSKLEEALELYGVLPPKEIRVQVDRELNNQQESVSSPVIEGRKEAEASVALDKGQTQTFSEDELKERSKDAKTKGKGE